MGWCLPTEKVLTPLRPGDVRGDLWTTFDVVQEHLLRGGDGYHRLTGGFRRHMTRPVVAIDKAQALNKALCALAEEFARN